MNVTQNLKGIYSRKREQLEKSSVTTCVFAAHLAVTVSIGLVTVGVEALISVTVARPTCRGPPPTPGTLVVNSAHVNKARTDATTAEWVCRVALRNIKYWFCRCRQKKNGVWGVAVRTFSHILQTGVIICWVIDDKRHYLSPYFNTARDSTTDFLRVDAAVQSQDFLIFLQNLQWRLNLLMWLLWC